MKNVTFLVVSFLRDGYLRACVESILKTYPQAKILIGDNGYPTDEKVRWFKELETLGVRSWFLPFDSGVAYGRNFLYNKAKTPFVVIGDDDFYYTKESGLDKMYGLVHKNKRIDVLGGRVVEGGKTRDYQGNIEDRKRGAEHSLHYSALTDGGYRTMGGVRYKFCDITFNYCIIRRSSMPKPLWDSNIKVAYEHSDFFLSARKRGMRVAFTPDAIVIHRPEHIEEPRTNEYLGYRSRKEDKEYFYKKWALDYTVDMSGRRDQL